MYAKMSESSVNYQLSHVWMDIIILGGQSFVWAIDEHQLGSSTLPLRQIWKEYI